MSGLRDQNAGLPVATSVDSAAEEILPGTLADSKTFPSIKIRSCPVLDAATPAVAGSWYEKKSSNPGVAVVARSRTKNYRCSPLVEYVCGFFFVRSIIGSGEGSRKPKTSITLRITIMESKAGTKTLMFKFLVGVASSTRAPANTHY